MKHESATNMDTIEAVEQYAAAQGIALNAGDRKRIAEAASAAREHSLTTTSGGTFADRFNRLYPRLLDAMLAAGNIAVAFIKTALLMVGVPAVLIALLIVEQHRVADGIGLFEVNTVFAAMAAWALVLANVVFELFIHHIEHTAGYTAARDTAWSLRIWWANAAYRLGIQSRWRARELSPAARFKAASRIVTFTILALALGGSMRAAIAATSGAWHEAITAILLESDLLTMATWAGGLLFAFSAVFGAQVLTRYVAISVVDFVAAMRERGTVGGDDHEAQRAAAAAALAIVNARLEAKAARAGGHAGKVADRPFLELEKAAQNGRQNGNGTP
jgi:hypothetical protein